MIRGGHDNTEPFDRYLIEEQDVDGSGVATGMGFVSFLDQISYDVMKYMKWTQFWSQLGLTILGLIASLSTYVLFHVSLLQLQWCIVIDTVLYFVMNHLRSHVLLLISTTILLLISLCLRRSTFCELRDNMLLFSCFSPSFKFVHIHALCSVTMLFSGL